MLNQPADVEVRLAYEKTYTTITGSVFKWLLCYCAMAKTTRSSYV